MQHGDECMRARLGLYILLWSLMTNLTLAKAEPLLWGHLKAGPFRVGFSSRWIVDESRGFDAILPDKTHYGTTKTPRPILVNEWYPAAMTQPSEATEVVQGSYLEIAPPSGPLGNLANALSQRARENIASEVIDADDLDSLTPQQQIALKRYLETRTASHRGAAIQVGQFPLVVYVQGYGSSFEDNTVLCEYLASHGYVVLNSAYQDEHLHMIGGMQIAGDDVQFLIHYGRDLPNVDSKKVALIGHSGGAQTVLAYQSRPGAMADAVVSLDTTEDYYYIDKYSHLKFVRQVDPEQLSVPILFAANPDAIFQLADTLKRSQRYYLTERDTDHDEFIAHGLSRVLMLEKPTLASVDYIGCSAR